MHDACRPDRHPDCHPDCGPDRGPDRRFVREPDHLVHRQFLRDWERLRCNRASLRRAAGWRVVEVHLDDLDVLVRIATADGPVADTVLRRLVDIARHDDLAARTVVRCLLPDLDRVHRRRRARYGAKVDFGDLMSTTWTVIRTFNPDRRPARLSAALVGDVEYREYRAEYRRIGQPKPAEPNRFDELTQPETTAPDDELDALIAAAADGLDPRDRDLLHRLRSGKRAIDIAAELAVTPRTIRNRRDRLVGKLREVTLAA